MKFVKGDRFGASKNLTGVELYCEVLSVTNNIISAQVLNGDWDIEFDADSLISTKFIDFSGRKMLNNDYKIVFANKIPKEYATNADAALEYMNKAVEG